MTQYSLPGSRKILYEHSLRSRTNSVNIYSEKADVLTILVPYLIQDGFNRCGEVFVAVAGLTGRDDIASCAFSFSGQWHQMIHGEVICADVFLAEVADP